MITDNEKRVMVGMLWEAHNQFGFHHKEMHRSIRFGIKNLPVFQAQLQELDGLTQTINQTRLSFIPDDMENTRKLKGFVGGNLPKIFQAQPLERKSLYRPMLRSANKLLGDPFHFDTFVQNDADRLACAVMDWYALYVAFMLNHGNSPISLQGIAVNALCETVVEQRSRDFRPSLLYEASLIGDWLKLEYGFNEKFLRRHGLTKHLH